MWWDCFYGTLTVNLCKSIDALRGTPWPLNPLRCRVPVTWHACMIQSLHQKGPTMIVLLREEHTGSLTAKPKLYYISCCCISNVQNRKSYECTSIHMSKYGIWPAIARQKLIHVGLLGGMFDQKHEVMACIGPYHRLI